MLEDYDGPILGDEQEGGGQEEDCALDNNATVNKYYPNNQQKYDLLLTLEGKKKNVMKKIKSQLKKHRGIKWFLSNNVKMVKTSPDGDVESTPHFRSTCHTTTNPNNLENVYDEAVEKIKTSFLEYQREGSGWQLEQVMLSFFVPPIHSTIHSNTYLFIHVLIYQLIHILYAIQFQS